MTTKRIEFNHLTQFLGRNGTGKCSGIFLHTSTMFDKKPVVYMQPLTSKGNTARCTMIVPVDALDDLISALQTIQIQGKYKGDL